MKRGKKKKQDKARRVLDRKSPRVGFSTDQEERDLRRLRAQKELALVERLGGSVPFYGVYEVRSAQWQQPYRVEIRSLDDHRNSCLCPDFLTNRLGTCKHIERVLQHVSNRKTRAFAEMRRKGTPDYEVFPDFRADPPVVRLLKPARPDAQAARVLDPFFGTDGVLLGDPVDALPSLERAVETASAPARGRIRISATTQPWREILERRRERQAAREAFLDDVGKGKRSLNPVRKPLYPYQQEGMLHLAFGRRALLADEMGLGKTVQAIAACELLQQLGRIRRALIVCPASLKAEWEDQIREFTGRDARLLFGPRAERLRVYREDHRYLIANYEQVRADLEDINRFFAPDVVILDEAQRIKNWPTKTAKAIKRLRSPYAFVLTGTPLENRIEEVYSLVEFLDPFLFGSLFRFQREFLRVDEEGNVEHQNLPELHRRVNAVMLRRRKADVEDDLPDRTVKTYFVEMEGEQRARYEDYETRANRLIAQAQQRPLRKEEFEMLQRWLACMRMICDTPYILDPACRICPKLVELEPVLDEILADRSAKALIFSEWVKMLDLVEELAREKEISYAVHTGRIGQRQRREEIRRFKQDEQCRLFLSSESGGSGLNLQAANFVINLDLPWNPARLEQRIARAWRKHQTRPVTVINLVTQHSIEHGMLGRLAHKRKLADSVLEGQGSEDGLQTERGRHRFLQELGEALGARLETGAGMPLPAAARRATPPAERLKQDLNARFSAQVLGIEAAVDRSAFLVITRASKEVEEIRGVAAEAVPEARVEVLDRATYELLQRLRQQGLIAFTGRMEVIARSPELGEPPASASPARPQLETARRHFALAGRKRKMMGALSDSELYPEAIGPAREAFRTAIESLHLYQCGQMPEEPLGEAVLGRLQVALSLPFDALSLRADLHGGGGIESETAELVRRTQSALDQVEGILAT